MPTALALTLRPHTTAVVAPHLGQASHSALLHALVAYEPRVGAYVETDAGGDDLRFVGNVLVYDPPNELTFEQDWVGHGWPVPALITIRLTASGAGTLVELFHHGFERFGSLTVAEDVHRGFEGGWTNRQMEALRSRVQG